MDRMDLQAILDSTIATSVEDEYDDDDEEEEEDEQVDHKGYYPPQFRSIVGSNIPDHGLMSDSLTEDDDYNQPGHLLVLDNDEYDEDEDEREGHRLTKPFSLPRQSKTYSTRTVNNDNNNSKATPYTTHPNSHGTIAAATGSANAIATAKGMGRGMDVVDLERILREDDDDPEDDDDSASDHLLFHSGHQPELLSYTFLPSTRTIPATTTAGIITTTTTANTPSSTSPEDWHVLQAILGEEEDDMEVITPMLHHSQNVPVDTILQQSDDDDDDDDEYHDDSEDDLDTTMIHNDTNDPLMILPQYIPNLHVPLKQGPPPTFDNNNNNTHYCWEEDMDLVPATQSNESFQTAHQSITDEPIIQNQPHHQQSQSLLSESQQAKASEKAMQYAQHYEDRLLKATLGGSGVAHNYNKDIVSPLMVKRRLKPKIYLQSKNSKASTSATGSSSTRGVATTPISTATSLTTATGAVELRHMHGVSATLAKQFKPRPRPSHQSQQQQQQSPPPPAEAQRDLPTALGMNDRFLAVGMQSGVCLIFDLFETFRKKLDKGGDTPFDSQTAGAVTTLDLSFEQGDVLVAGYTSGYIVLWDVLKGVALRTVIESPTSSSSSSLPTPPSCMTHVRFLKGLEVVTVDAGGLVNKLAFTKNLLWSSYSVESECLLDGTAGQILAMNVLDPTLNNHSTTSTTTTSNMHPKGLVLIALSSERSSFAVAVAPAVHVLYRWARPSPESVNGQPTTNLISSSMTNHHTTQVYLPCLTWGWALVSGGDNVKTPILARAWGCAIQLLRASFQDQTTTSPNNHGSMEDENPNAIVWPAFGVHDEFASSSPVVAMEWLNDRSLVYLSVHNEFTVVDTVMMTLVEKIDCSGMSLVYAEFSLSRSSSHFSQQEQQHQQQHVSTEDSSPTFCTTFQNSIRSRDNRLLLLCQEELQSVSIVGAKRRISQLEQDGEWLEALASALDHYESTIMSQQDRRRELRKDLTKHPEYASTAHSQLLLSPDEEWIAKLLIRYMNIGMENAPDLSDTELAQSHFQMLAGVCVEFCVVTKRLDLLYGPIFRRFHSVGCLAVFLDVLEPYILNDKLDYIAPEAMAHFVEHCRLNNGMSTVERCLLHMDVTIMDFDSILTLLKANEMYSALFYVYNQGLDDYSSPLEILLEKLFDASDTLGSSSHGNKWGSGSKLTSRKVGAPTNDLEKYGYKAILYLQYCFQGRTFPQNIIIEDEQKLSQIRSEILLFLLQENFTPKAVRKHTQLVGRRTQIYPYTTILLLVDPKAMLQTLSLAMDAPDGFFQRGGVEATTSLESIGGWEVEVGTDRSSHHRNNNTSSTTRTPDRQEIIRMLSSIILPVEYSGMTLLTQTSPGGGSLSRSQPAINALLDFLAEYLMKGVVRANKQVTFLVLNRMATRFESAMDARERLESQQRILDLLTALPHNSYVPEEVLVLVQKSGIHRAALLLHQEGASSWGKHSESQQELEHRAYHFKAAIDCYLDDDDSDFCKEVFLYVKKECSGISSDYQQNDLKGETYEPNLLRTALASKLADLVQLDSLLTAELIAELFVDDLDSVVSQLHDEQAQFLFFQAIISGALDQKDQVAGAVLNTNLTVEHHHRYLELMAKLHPDDVYEYLQTHDNYRPEACLPLCQQYDIADASCYLLERMGNVTSGLQLILQTLDSRMMGLKRIIRGMGTSITYNKYSAGLRHPKLDSSNPAAVVAMEATEREIQGVKRILIVALDLCERNSGTFSSRTEHGSRLWFNVLDRLINAKGFLRLSKEQPSHARIMAGVLSDLLRLVMQRMVSSVPLPDLVRKVTSDHSGSRLGELREMVESLLSTYGFELTLFEGAVSVFHYDMKQMRGQHRSLRIQGDRVASTMNTQPMSDATNTALQRRNDADPSSGTLFAPTAVTTTTTTSGSSLLEGESQGLGTALLKLQRRRQFHQDKSFSTSRHRGLHHRRSIINLMPESERRIFVDGHVNPDATYWEDRVAGLLGNAEHSGRFRSFFY